MNLNAVPFKTYHCQIWNRQPVLDINLYDSNRSYVLFDISMLLIIIYSRFAWQCSWFSSQWPVSENRLSEICDLFSLEIKENLVQREFGCFVVLHWASLWALPFHCTLNNSFFQPFGFLFFFFFCQQNSFFLYTIGDGEHVSKETDCRTHPRYLMEAFHITEKQQLITENSILLLHEKLMCQVVSMTNWWP